MPKVSAIIPTYNRREYLQKAIDSVLAQSYTDFELIVIDDGSSDGTDEMMRQVYGDKVRYIWQENQGESYARNHGIREARGEYLAFLDSDDVWLPDKLARQVPVLDADPELGMVYGQSFHMDPDGKILPDKPYGADVRPDQVTVEVMLVRNVMTGICTNGLFRLDALQAIGGFDHRIQYGEDWDLGIRLLAHSKVAFLPVPLSCNRDHPGKQSIVVDRTRIAQRLKDVLFCLDHYLQLFSQPKVQLLIQQQRCRQLVKSALFFLATGGLAEAESLLEKAVQQNREVALDWKLWQEQVAASAWVVFASTKRLERVEEFAEQALLLKQKRGGDDQHDRQIYADLYLAAVRWFSQDDLRAAAFEALWKLVKIRPQFIFSVQGVKTCLQLVLGKRLAHFLASLPQSAKRRRN